jgi:hypothetical protein
MPQRLSIADGRGDAFRRFFRTKDQDPLSRGQAKHRGAREDIKITDKAPIVRAPIDHGGGRLEWVEIRIDASSNSRQAL